MIYITGDTHGDFQRIFDFCMRFETSVDDVMVILGDAGINFSGGFKDQVKKDYIAAMPITLFCIHGNHEQRPFTIPSYEETEWHAGIVYVEKEYPNIMFAKDGEIFLVLVYYSTFSLEKPYQISLPRKNTTKSRQYRQNWRRDL